MVVLGKWHRCYPPVPLFCGRTSMYTFFFLSFLHIGTPFFGQKRGVSPVFNQLWEPAASSRLVGVPPRGSEIPLRLDPSVRRRDFVRFNYVDRSFVGPRPDTKGIGPMVPIYINGGVYRSPRIVTTIEEGSIPGRKLPFTGDMISSSHWHFGVGSATCFVLPST